MTDIKKLRTKMYELGISVERLSTETEISKDTLYRRFKNNGDDFTVLEVQLIAKALSLNEDEIMEIFFARSVA